MKKTIFTFALCAAALCARANLFGLKYNSYTTNTDANVPVAAGATVAAALSSQTNAVVTGLTLKLTNAAPAFGTNASPTNILVWAIVTNNGTAYKMPLYGN